MNKPALGFALFYVGLSLILIFWWRKKKKTGKKISVWFKLSTIFFILTGPSILLSIIAPQPGPEPEQGKEQTAAVYYIKASAANVRECPKTSCKIIGTYPQNTELVFPGDLFDKYPEWVEVTFPDGKVGYINKTTLSEKPASASQPPPAAATKGTGGTGGTSSKGGITIGPWNDLQVTVGESYEFYFCEPASAISGATCDGLAGATTDPRGGTPPYSFVKKSGFLPPGMALELNGTLKGTPSEEGTYNFRFCAKDLYGGEGCQNLAVVVKKEKALPVNGDAAGSVGVDITIDSITCVLGYKDDYDRLVFSVSAAGTATGPIDTYFSVWSSEPDERYTAAEPYSILTNIDPEIKTSSWTEEYRDNRTYSNKRAQKDSATTSWEMHKRPVPLYNASVRNSTMVRIIVEVRNDNTVPTDKKEIFKDVACSS